MKVRHCLPKLVIHFRSHLNETLDMNKCIDLFDKSGINYETYQVEDPALALLLRVASGEV